MTTQRITDDLDRLLERLPDDVREALQSPERREQLLEVVLDLGRVPEARYPGRALALGEACLTKDDLQAMVARLGRFGADNRWSASPAVSVAPSTERLAWSVTCSTVPSPFC